MTFTRSGPAIGSRPGTLAPPPGSPPPRVHIMRYSTRGAEELDLEDLEQLSSVTKPETVTWIDVQGLGDADVLTRIGDAFSLHPTVLETAVNIPQRARSELFDDYHVLVARVPASAENRPVTPPQVCMVIGRGWLLTFQERYFGFFDAVRERVRAGRGPIWSQGADYLAYALLDSLVDRYFPIAEALTRRLDGLEDEIAKDPHPDVLGELHAIRRHLVVIRRVGWPQREAIGSLLRDPSSFVSDDVRSFLRQTHDHMAQIVELVDASRETATGLSEVYLSQVSFRTNEVMKLLTLMASLFIPLTFIAGIYGMNFQDMPELRQPGGYYFVLGVMAAVAVGMLGYFRYKGWLGQGRRRP